MGPVVSRWGLTASVPPLETAPAVGRRPVMPFSAAGSRTEAPVSVPSAASAMPSATATADPPLDPPGTRPASQALPQAPNQTFWVVPP